MSTLYKGKEASTPLTQLNQLKVALGFEQHLPTATIIQYLEDGLVTVKHSKDVPEQVITESQESSLAAAAANHPRRDAPDVMDPAKVVETPTHESEPTTPRAQDEKAETLADKQDDSQPVDNKQALKDAKADEKKAPEGPTVVKDEDKKPATAPAEDTDKTKK